MKGIERVFNESNRQKIMSEKNISKEHQMLLDYILTGEKDALPDEYLRLEKKVDGQKVRQETRKLITYLSNIVMADNEVF